MPTQRNRINMWSMSNSFEATELEMLMNKGRWVRKYTSRSETRGSVYFILLYSFTMPLKQVFKMAAFGLYTQSGPFSAPTEMRGTLSCRL
jgi:hypothetical protein